MRVSVANHLGEDAGHLALRRDVYSGLQKTPKSLPPKWFYDTVGSELFDQITRLPEYYPTRAEAEILRARSAEVASACRADTLVELGSGTSEKTRMLLDALRHRGSLRNSQGAAVAGYVTSAVVPPAVPVQAVPAPMAPEVANHVAAVTLFGAPSAQFLGQYGAPPIAIGPLYQPKTLQLCADGDSICGDGNSPVAHGLYAVNGMVGQGANFAASRL